MDITTILLIYAWGWAVAGFALIDEWSKQDVLISFAAALLWPIVVPAGWVRTACRPLKRGR